MHRPPPTAGRAPVDADRPLLARGLRIWLEDRRPADAAAAAAAAAMAGEEIEAAIKAKGDEIREMKSK